MKRFENFLKLAASLSVPLWSATNTVDGGKADWAELDPIEIDPEADTLPHRSEDLLSIRVANDADNVHFMLDYAGNPSPSTLLETLRA